MENYDAISADLDNDILERLFIKSDAALGFELLKQSIARRQRAYDTWKRNNTDESSAEYFTARRLVKRAVK